MKFSYKAYTVPGIGATSQVTIHRPTIPLHVFGPGGECDAYGLLDTGADDTLLPNYLMDQLGLPMPIGERIKIVGIGGAINDVVFATVDLEISRGKLTYRWSARVGFYGGIRAILGHSGVLEHFLATFNHRQRYATLQPNGPLPPPAMLAP